MNNNYNNPFLDYLKTSMNSQGLTNMFKDMPAMDFSACSNMLKQSAENLASLNQVVVENIHDVVKKSAETIQHNTHEFLNFVKESVNANDAEQVAAKGQQYFKNSLQKSMDSGKEMMDMTSKSSMDLLNKFSSNISENVNNNLNKNKK